MYNGNTTVSNSDLNTFSNIVSGETLGLSGSGSVSSANTGNSKTVSLGTLALQNGSGSASNYSISSASLSVNPIAISLSGSRTYDGSSLASASDLTISGLIGSETLVLSGAGTITSSAVANNYDVSQGSLSLGDGSNGGLAANYTLNGSTRTLNITPRILNISGTRVYDGTTNAVSSDLTLSNLVGSETLALSGTGTITSANVGNNKSVSLNTLEINNDTGVASNYTLNGGTHQLSVSRRDQLVCLEVGSYNGSTTVNSSDLSVFNNLVSGETLDITGSGTVSSANVGLSKSVTIGSLSLSNGTGSSANYTLGSATLDITQKSLTISGSKVYDGTNVIQGSNFSTFSGIVSGETLSMTGSGTVASGNIGNDKTVTNTSLQLLDGSGLASNYSIANTISADITLRPVNLSGSRVYDGTTDAAASDLSLGNLVSGENISLSGTGTLGSAAVGSQTITNIGSLAISDGSSSASNYSLTGALSMAITKRPVTVTGSKFYDGTTNAAASNLTSFTNLVSGETLTLWQWISSELCSGQQ